MPVEHYSFGRIIIDGKTYTSDVIVGNEITKWWRKEGHVVQLEDIHEILKQNPEVVIFGTGKYGVMKVSEEVINELKSRNIEVIIEKTEKAVKVFNEMIGKKNVVFAVHLTC